MDERNKFLKMSSIYKNEKLSKYNWFNLGGPAKLFIKIDKIEELKNFLLENNTNDAKIMGIDNFRNINNAKSVSSQNINSYSIINYYIRLVI